jgi:hypothetical protein
MSFFSQPYRQGARAGRCAVGSSWGWLPIGTGCRNTEQTKENYTNEPSHSDPPNQWIGTKGQALTDLKQLFLLWEGMSEGFQNWTEVAQVGEAEVGKGRNPVDTTLYQTIKCLLWVKLQSPKLTHVSPNPQYLRKWPYLEIMSLWI